MRLKGSERDPWTREAGTQPQECALIFRRHSPSSLCSVLCAERSVPVEAALSLGDACFQRRTAVDQQLCRRISWGWSERRIVGHGDLLRAGFPVGPSTGIFSPIRYAVQGVFVPDRSCGLWFAVLHEEPPDPRLR